MGWVWKSELEFGGKKGRTGTSSRANGTGKDTASGPAAQCGQNLKEEGAGEETALAKGERGKVGRVNRGGVYKAKCNKAP